MLTRKPRERQNCPHCNIRHNKHKDVASGCRDVKIVKPTNLTLLSSGKDKELNPDPLEEPSSDSSESEQGEIQDLRYWEDSSNSSSSYQPSKARDDEESIDSSDPLRINILNQ